ncbi:hypothetical protein [Streptodolium elevatio]
MSWAWEYHPDEDTRVGGMPPVFVALVEGKAAELVRAAEAKYLDGTLYEGFSEPGTVFVGGGMFDYLIIQRHERVYIMQVTPPL